MTWFVDPTATVKLDLPGGEWIEVKRELSYGDEQALAASMMGDIRTIEKSKNASLGVDMRRYQLKRFTTWITAWSARGPNGKAIEVNEAAVANLRSEIAAAIDAALDAHIAALEDEKKGTTPTGTPND